MKYYCLFLIGQVNQPLKFDEKVNFQVLSDDNFINFNLYAMAFQHHKNLYFKEKLCELYNVFILTFDDYCVKNVAHLQTKFIKVVDSSFTTSLSQPVCLWIGCLKPHPHETWIAGI